MSGMSVNLRRVHELNGFLVGLRYALEAAAANESGDIPMQERVDLVALVFLTSMAQERVLGLMDDGDDAALWAEDGEAEAAS